MDYAEPFEESIEIAQSYLSDINAPLILIGVTDDTELRRHFLAELRQRLGDSVDLRDFLYDPQHISLLEGALAAANRNGAEANGHRIAVSAIGLEALPNEEQQNAIKLLNAERNRLGYANLIVLLWLNRKLFTEVANKSYDFYSCSSQTFFLEPPSDWSAADRLDSLRRSYLQAIISQNQYVNLQGLAPMRGGRLVDMPMDEIFIPLHVERVESSSLAHLLALSDDPLLSLSDEPISLRADFSGSWTQEKKRMVDRYTRLGQRESVSRRAEIPELLRLRRAVVLGDPGAGKTTMLRYVAYRLAKSLLSVEQPEEEQAGTPALPGNVADCLPVYIRIGLYVQHLKDHPDATIADFAPQQNPQLPLTEELLREAIKRGKAIFLLDGLDEIIATSQRREVAQAVDGFALEYPDCPVIVTSRVVGYRETPLGSEFEQFTIRPFDDDEIEAFVRHWHEAIGQPERAEALIGTIRKQEAIRKLASNPLLLTVISLIHLRNVKLPNRRVEFYQKAAETLVDNWMSERRVTPDDWDSDEALDALLPAVAWRLHAEASGGLINQDDLHQLLVETTRARNPRLTEAEAHARAAQFRRNVSEFSGIFLERGLDEAGRGIYGFLHLTFEEYFAAIRLKDRWKREGDKVLKPILHHPRWKEVILLCAGNMDQFDATRFIEAILDARGEYESVLHRDLLLAARCLADDIRVDPDLRRRVVSELIELYFSAQSPWGLKDDVRKAFAELAGTFANDDLVAELEKRLAGSEWFVRVAAARAIEAMGESAASDRAVECLLELLADSDRNVRKAAVIAIGAMGERAASERTSERLLDLLSDREWGIQYEAARALGRVGERAVSERALERLLSQVPDSDEAVMGEQAVNEQTLERVLNLLSDSDRSNRYGAMFALREMGKRAASERTLEILLDLLGDSDGNIRSDAAGVLGAMGEIAASKQTIERLLDLLNDNNWFARAAAAGSVGKLSSQLRPEIRPEMAKRFLSLARKRGKSDKIMYQRNTGYVALRNLLAADVK